MVFGKLKRFEKGWLRNRDFGEVVRGLATLVIRWCSKWKWMWKWVTANWVTLFGLLACVPMTVLYLMNEVFLASILMAFSLGTDFVDGALAHHQQDSRPLITLEEERQLTWLERINYRGVTHLGKSLDPFTDKVRFYCGLYTLGYGIVPFWLIVSLTSVGVALTVIRPIKRIFNLGDTRSNRFGKIKMMSEVVALASITFVPNWTLIVMTTFTISLLFGFASLGGHLLGLGLVLYKRRFVPSRVRSPSTAAKVDADF
jgi:phosphatidylglycerophosphate synthase